MCNCNTRLRTAFLDGSGLPWQGKCSGERIAARATGQGARAVEVDDEQRRGARHATKFMERSMARRQLI